MSDSSEPTIPIAAIAACAGVGGLLVIFVILRIGLCIHRRRRHEPIPLPPARPLTAIHTSPWNANPTMNGSMANFSSSKVDLSSPTSASPVGYYYPEPSPSMVQRGDPRNVYRQFSGSTLNTDEMPLQQPSSPITRASSPLSGADGQLVPPQPSFFASQGMNSDRSSAQLSLNSSTEESDIASYPPQRHQNVMPFPMDPMLDDPAGGGFPNGMPYPPNSSPRIAGPSSRRLSVAASVSTIQTTRSMRSTRTHSTVRGAPHKPHSRVEIILPAPLAPPTQRESFYAHDLNDYTMSSRQSVCDPWLKVGRENTAPVNNYPPPPIREGERRHRAVSSEFQSAPRERRARRTSASSYSSSTTNPNFFVPPSPNPNPYTFSARSRSPSISSQSRYSRNKVSLDLSDLPPVPRVPSIYTNSPGSTAPPSPVLAISDSITGNGKLRGSESDLTVLRKALPSNVDSKRHTPPNVVEEQASPSAIAIG